MKKLYLTLLLAVIVLSCNEKQLPNNLPYSNTDFFVDPSIQSGMMIQRNSVFPISGTGTPGGKIKIVCSWEDDSSVHEIVISESGRWTENINTPEATGEKLKISISGIKTVVFDYIIAGDIWICCGQSNMYLPLKNAEFGAKEASLATNKNIRLLSMKRVVSDKPEETFSSRWVICNPNDAAEFSAVGFFFGKTLSEETGVPIGLINASWGNTGIEVWIDRERVMKNKILADYARDKELKPHGDGSPNICGSAYNAMIYPLSRYPVKGVIWYQGSNNQDQPYIYPDFFRTLAENWRSVWKNEMPFYIAQICPYERVWDFPTNYSNPAMRYMQAVSAESVPGCAVEVNDDVADIHDIHPKKKKEVGQRLAWMALEQTYGMESFSRLRCPLYDGAVAGDGKMTVSFRYAEGGLSTSDGMAPSGFELAGDDRVFYPAEAEIEGSSVVLHSPDVPEPVFVRLGWSYTRTTNLRSASGLPVGVFRNYDWEEPEEER